IALQLQVDAGTGEAVDHRGVGTDPAFRQDGKDPVAAAPHAIDGEQRLEYGHQQQRQRMQQGVEDDQRQDQARAQHLDHRDTFPPPAAAGSATRPVVSVARTTSNATALLPVIVPFPFRWSRPDGLLSCSPGRFTRVVYLFTSEVYPAFWRSTRQAGRGIPAR